VDYIYIYKMNFLNSLCYVYLNRFDTYLGRKKFRIAKHKRFIKCHNGLVLSNVLFRINYIGVNSCLGLFSADCSVV